MNRSPLLSPESERITLGSDEKALIINPLCRPGCCRPLSNRKFPTAPPLADDGLKCGRLAQTTSFCRVRVRHLNWWCFRADATFVEVAMSPPVSTSRAAHALAMTQGNTMQLSDRSKPNRRASAIRLLADVDGFDWGLPLSSSGSIARIPILGDRLSARILDSRSSKRSDLLSFRSFGCASRSD